VITADTITDEQIRHVRDIAPEQFSAEACADALGLPPGPYDAPRAPEEMQEEQRFQRHVAAYLFNARAEGK
jgi:hypothetical protein